MNFYELLDADELNFILNSLKDIIIYIEVVNERLVVRGNNDQLVMAVETRILQEYLLVFKLLCSNNVTAITTWDEDVVLIGVLADALHDGRYVWTPAEKIYSWPGTTKTLKNLQESGNRSG